MKLEYKDKLFWLHCDYEKRHLPKLAGFAWNKKERTWATPFLSNVKKIPYSYLSKEDFLEASKGKDEQIKTYLASSSITSSLNIPTPAGLKFYDFQRAGIQFMIEQKRVLLADQMGIGKTIQAIGLCNFLEDQMNRPLKILIVCPASLKVNWHNEWLKWTTTPFSVDIATSKFYPESLVVIINYDILIKYEKKIKEKFWDVLILDESHYLKNTKAQRTRVLFGSKEIKKIEADRVLALTGTPILNKPIEIYSILKFLNPAGWSNKVSFAKRYCNATENSFGWDMSGASNLDELQAHLRSTVMIRRLKKDVLKDLPEKTRQILEISLDDRHSKKIINAEKEMIQKMVKNNLDENYIYNDEEFSNIIKNFTGFNTNFSEISSLRKEIAMSKLNSIITHLEDCLESTDKIVCFAYHTDLIDAIKNHFKESSVVIKGSTSMKDRHNAVQSFQENKEIKLFIGNIKSAGVGLTLTAAYHIVFAELTWSPGELSQAEDRCHRIGQKNNLLIQHLLLKGSIDFYVIKTIINKQEIIDKALNIS